MCLVFGVTVWGNPQIVRLQKRFAVEFSPVVRKRSFLKKSMKPELCAVRVFFFQITAAFHFFAIRPPSAICSDHNICLLSFCPCGKGTYADESSSLSSASRKRRYFPVASFIPAFLAAHCLYYSDESHGFLDLLQQVPHTFDWNDLLNRHSPKQSPTLNSPVFVRSQHTPSEIFPPDIFFFTGIITLTSG